ncbi:Vanin-like protein 2 [Armadillidium vulgare]|nr:Vanin-like protein 2 [Armadillidium vulgare]
MITQIILMKMKNVKFLLNILLRISCLHFCIFNIVASNTVKRSSLNPNLGLEIPKSSNSFDEENRVRYIGAVLEFEPFNKWSEEGKGYDVIRKNAKTVVEFAEKAKTYNTDIIIAPEYGIQSLSMFHNNTENFLTFTQYVPDPSLRMVVCDQEEEPVNKYEGIRILSCGARTNEIYIVADLAEFVPCSKETIDRSLPWGYKIHENCPDGGYFIHNTQVVFDRKGAV